MTKKNYFWRQQVWLPIAKGADYWCNVATETFCLLLFFGTPCLLALVLVLIVALAPKELEDSPRVETSGEGLGGQADLDKHKHKHKPLSVCLLLTLGTYVDLSKSPPRSPTWFATLLPFLSFSLSANMCQPWAMYCTYMLPSFRIAF